MIIDEKCVIGGMKKHILVVEVEVDNKQTR